MAKKSTCQWDADRQLWVSTTTGRTYTDADYQKLKAQGRKGTVTFAARARMQQIESYIITTALANGFDPDHSRVFQMMMAKAEGEDVRMENYLLKVGSPEHEADLQANAERKAKADKVHSLWDHDGDGYDD